MPSSLCGQSDGTNVLTAYSQKTCNMQLADGLRPQNAFLRKAGLPYTPLDPAHVDPSAAARDGGTADPAQAEALQVLHRPVGCLPVVLCESSTAKLSHGLAWQLHLSIPPGALGSLRA
jgi:hypothetical protein